MRPGVTARVNWTALATALALASALPSGCRRPGAAPATAAPSVLPERIGGFVGGPLATDAVAARRTYARGASRVDVTMARFPMNDGEYARWVETSRGAFPQASLDAPPDQANGFYQCADGPDPACSLLVQLRSGVHVEIRADGQARRADLDLVAAGLPLRALAGDADLLLAVAQHRR